MNVRNFIAAAIAASLSSAALAQDYGKPGGPVTVVVGYQPYYTQSWSGVVMRGKKFYEKYLPKGSNVEFQIGLQGAIIVNNMLAGKQHIGYMGDMPSIVSTTKTEVADVRLVANLGLGYDQCNIFLARNDAPQFPNANAGAAAGSTARPSPCRRARAPTATRRPRSSKLNINPKEYLNQNIEVITSNFRAGKLDAAVIWEPTASRLVQEGLARRIASGRERAGERRRLPRHARRPDQGASRRGQGLAAGRARRAALHRRPEERARGDQDGEGADHRLR